MANKYSPVRLYRFIDTDIQKIEIPYVLQFIGMHNLFYLFKNRFTWYLILSAVLSNMRNMTLCIKWRLILSQCIIPLTQKTILSYSTTEFRTFRTS